MHSTRRQFEVQKYSCLNTGKAGRGNRAVYPSTEIDDSQSIRTGSTRSHFCKPVPAETDKHRWVEKAQVGGVGGWKAWSYCSWHCLPHRPACPTAPSKDKTWHHVRGSEEEKQL